MKLFFKNCKRQVTHSLSMKKSLVIVIISILNVACSAVGPDYVAPQLIPPIQWNGEIGSQLNTSPLDPKAFNQWWETLQDPVLTDLIERSIMGNLSLRDAQDVSLRHAHEGK